MSENGNQPVVPRYGIFVSYAQVNDQPPSDSQTGWVTTLVNNLRRAVSENLGRKDSAKWWMDHDLRGNGSVTDTIDHALSKSDVFLLVHSIGYAASEWCRAELEKFQAACKGEADAASRIFMVEYDQITREARLEGLSGLRGYKFWYEEEDTRRERRFGYPVPLTTDLKYYAAISDLAADIAEQLRRIEHQVPAGSTRPGRKGPVFLAEVTDDLEDQRQEMRRFLDQAGWDVVPNDTEFPRGDQGAFKAAVKADMDRCDFFVQLLSEFPGKKPSGWTKPFVSLQLEAAKARSTPGDKPMRIIQWRKEGLKREGVKDLAHQTILFDGSVLEMGSAEFREEVDRIISQPVPRVVAGAVADEPFILIHNDVNDRKEAQQIYGKLANKGVGCAVSPTGGATAAEELQGYLMGCDGVIVVYGASQPHWVRKSLWGMKTLLPRRGPLHGVSVYASGPPPPKEEVGLRLPNMDWIDAQTASGEADLFRFVDKVKIAKARRGS